MQVTRQSLEDRYDLKEVIAKIKSCKDVPVVTDDNYAVMKIKEIGCEAGGDLACFSTFKLQGPEGIGCVDEEYDYKEVGVYDPQDIQKKINEQCLQMEPVVRPLLTVVEKDEKFFVSAEIPGIDLVERPCHYKGQGRLKGSYTRIGDSDEQKRRCIVHYDTPSRISRRGNI